MTGIRPALAVPTALYVLGLIVTIVMFGPAAAVWCVVLSALSALVSDLYRWRKTRSRDA